MSQAPEIVCPYCDAGCTIFFGGGCWIEGIGQVLTYDPSVDRYVVVPEAYEAFMGYITNTDKCKLVNKQFVPGVTFKYSEERKNNEEAKTS